MGNTDDFGTGDFNDGTIKIVQASFEKDNSPNKELWVNGSIADSRTSNQGDPLGTNITRYGFMEQEARQQSLMVPTPHNTS